MPSTLSTLWLHFSTRAVGLFLFPFCRLRIQGLENVPRHGGVVLASNHLSMFDTLVIPYSINTGQGPQTVWAPAKEELFRLSIASFFLNSWGVFPIRRGKNDLRGIRRMLTHMRSGKMMLFPEGTRSRDGELREGNRMLGKIIYQARPVVIPTLVAGTDRVWGSSRWRPRWRAPVSLRYGRPLDLQPYFQRPNSKETAEAIVKEIMGAIGALMYNDRPATTSRSAPSARLQPEGPGDESPRF